MVKYKQIKAIQEFNELYRRMNSFVELDETVFIIKKAYLQGKHDVKKKVTVSEDKNK